MNESTISESVRTAVDSGKEAVDTIKARVTGARTNITEGGQAAISNAISFIEANPMKAIGLAFGAGYLAMRITTSPLLKLAAVGGLVFLGKDLVKRS